MNLLTEVPIHQIYAKITKKKASAGKSCDLHAFTLEQVAELVGTGKCHYTGREFSSMENATFERVNPCIGYVAGNVVMVCYEANNHKSQLDAFVKGQVIPRDMKIKLLRKALYQLEKQLK